MSSPPSLKVLNVMDEANPKNKELATPSLIGSVRILTHGSENLVNRGGSLVGFFRLCVLAVLGQRIDD